MLNVPLPLSVPQAEPSPVQTVPLGQTQNLNKTEPVTTENKRQESEDEDDVDLDGIDVHHRFSSGDGIPLDNRATYNKLSYTDMDSVD